MIENREQIQEITKNLEEGIRNTFQSDKYKAYLNTMSKFHKYSATNVMLIHQQRPDATCVAGYKSWKRDFNRQVNAGEQAIKILAPNPYRHVVEEPILDKSGRPRIGADGNILKKITEEYIVKGYKTVSVFDISQTKGDPLPRLCQELKGTVKDYENFKEALERFSPVPFETISRDTKEFGYYSNMEKKIGIREGLSQIHTIKTSIHEVAHSILHDVDTGWANAADVKTKEIQAESIAYTVCQHYGIDTSEYSFNYVAAWSSGKDLSELKESMNIIQEASHDMINGIDEKLREIQLEQNREVELSNEIEQGYGLSR